MAPEQFFLKWMILRRSTPCSAFLNLAARSETSALLTTWRMDIIIVVMSFSPSDLLFRKCSGLYIGGGVSLSTVRPTGA
ncbi:hypothetical protein EVAR_28644_1 [Eumeta japonica]|uniref:Uncharacterized protein n=1 Tax=Eumeta variegata TaxID=151549 RepID=A0A4C1ZKD5_EUMVA|nr:hypothetical protein EVAR_28644_1 [Eumeta japonica]